MTRKHISTFCSFFLIAILVLLPLFPTAAQAKTKLNLIALSDYRKTMDIGEEFYLIAIPTSGKQPSFKSSDSSIASVNTYGLVTAKKAGTCSITAYVKNAEASCKLTVRKTTVSLSKSNATLENGQSLTLTYTASTAQKVKWKSSKTSIASVSEDGTVTAKKPGKCDITLTVDGTTATCKLTVKEPTLKLSDKSITLYRNQTHRLTANISSGKKPTFKSSSKKVASVNSCGLITGQKHGTATITVSLDGVSKECQVTVLSPEITLSDSELTLPVGQSYSLTASVSSGNAPSWSSSNINVATVDECGNVTARQKGKAYIYAKEDGAKASCILKVTD